MQQRDQPCNASLTLLAGLIVAVVILWLGYWWGLSRLIAESTIPYQNRGQFGDMFGGLNALFSALAFAGLLYAIALQRNELALQRRELELTRVELHGQKEQLEAQNKNPA